MSRPTPRCRRLIAVGAAVLALGTAGHAACQAIEHHDGAKDAVALCAAAVVALIVTLRMAAGGRTTRLRVPLVRWLVAWLLPMQLLPVGSRTSAIWLQRFQN